jgi:hypothetical protein
MLFEFIGYGLAALVSLLLAAGLLTGCGATTCQTARLALWQDLQGQYRATMRCGQVDGTHTDHDFLTSTTAIEAPQCHPCP